MKLLEARLINVSNRLPVLIRNSASGARIERSSGGLATALNAAWRHQPGVWIGWAGPGQGPEVEHLLAKASRRRCSRPASASCGAARATLRRVGSSA